MADRQISRRFFLQSAAIGGAFAAIHGASAQDPAKKRPNILFFFADDWGRMASAYGGGARESYNDVVNTPTIDRVAKEGALFTNAYMPVPQCTPCRASLATGAYFWRTGAKAFLHGQQEKGDPGFKLPGVPELLSDSGYYVASTGKTYEGIWSAKRRVLNDPPLKRYSLYISEAETEEEITQRRQDIENQTRRNMREVLEQHGDQPFFYVYGLVNCHRPWVRGSGKRLWGIEPDSLEGKLPAFLPDVHDVREDMADYLGEVQALDFILGLLLDELEQAGELENTLVVLTGDNGIPGFPRGKCNLYDFGNAAPLMACWPGRAPGGRVIDDFVNIMDTAPTFLEAAGVQPPETMNARSLLPLLLADKSGQIDAERDAVICGRERHVLPAREGAVSYPSRCIRTKDFLYIRNFKPDRWPMGDPYNLGDIENAPSYAEIAEDTYATFLDMDASPTKAWLITHRYEPQWRRFFDIAFRKRPEEELYDLRKDPDQMMNLKDDPAYTEVKQVLRSRMMQTLEDTNDPRLDDAFDRPPYTVPERDLERMERVRQYS